MTNMEQAWIRDQNRERIVEALTGDWQMTTEIEAASGVSSNAAVRHLLAMRRDGKVERRKEHHDGRVRVLWRRARS